METTLRVRGLPPPVAVIGQGGVESFAIRPRGEAGDDPLPGWDSCDAVLEMDQEATLFWQLWDAQLAGWEIGLEIRAGALGRHAGQWRVEQVAVCLGRGAKVTLRPVDVVTTLD